MITHDFFLHIQPRNRSEPDIRHPLNRSERQQRRQRHHKTAPVINMYFQSPFCGDRGDHHCRFTQQHYPLDSVYEDSSDEQEEYDVSDRALQPHDLRHRRKQQSKQFHPHPRQGGNQHDFSQTGRSPNDERTPSDFNSSKLPRRRQGSSKSDLNGKLFLYISMISLS